MSGRKVGRKENREIIRYIPLISRERPLQNPEAIKRRYKELTGRGIGYDTVRKALNELVEDGAITEKVINQTEKRRTVVYSLV